MFHVYLYIYIYWYTWKSRETFENKSNSLALVTRHSFYTQRMTLDRLRYSSWQLGSTRVTWSQPASWQSSAVLASLPRSTARQTSWVFAYARASREPSLLLSGDSQFSPSWLLAWTCRCARTLRDCARLFSYYRGPFLLVELSRRHSAKK